MPLPVKVVDGLEGRPTGCKKVPDWCMNRASECIPAALFVHFSVRFGEVFATMTRDDGVFRRLHTHDVAAWHAFFSGRARAQCHLF